MTGGAKSISIERDGAVTTVVLDRPDRGNMLNQDMLERFLRALEAVEKDKTVRVVVIAGAGNAFCMGIDPHARRPDRRSPAPDMGRILADAVMPVVLRLREMERPVIAAAHGAVAGAGLGLFAAADIALAEQGTMFSLGQVSLALGPEGGASWFLPRLIGLARARALAMTGETFDAEEAQAHGLLWRVVAPGTVRLAAGELAQRLSGRAPQTLSLVKRMFEATTVASLEEQLQVEANVQRRLGRTEDHREAVAALAEGRSPVFRGQ